MGVPAAVDLLPEGVREELHARLIASGFGGYEELSDWLTERGFSISKSALHRHGQKFKLRLDALKISTEMAKAVVEATPDDEGALNDALIRLVQDRLFQVLVELQVDDMDVPSIDKIARAIAELGKATVGQKRLAADIKTRVAKAADSVDELVRSEGLSAETIDKIRAEILGVQA